MKNIDKNLRILALLLLAAMLLSTFASCEGVIITPNTTTTTTNNGTEPDPSVHVCEFGEWELVKEATSTTDGLSERKCEECGKAEQRIIPASAKEYTITYIDAPQHNNPTKYTVNDYIDLQKAVWNGLSFAYWTDKDGNIVEEIPYGTEGNITLYANWRLTENFTYSVHNDTPIVKMYDEETDNYYFVYKIGTISDVVLDQLSSYRYNGATNHTWSISKTVSFTESKAQTVADTISKSITNSSSWGSTYSNTASHSSSASTNVSASVSAEVGIPYAKVSSEISASEGYESSSGSSSTLSKSSSGSSGSSSATSQSVTSGITYVADTSTQVTRTEELNPSISFPGLYKYARVGTINVYMIITYDIDKKDYFIDIYSYINDVSETMLYEPIPEYNGDLRIVDSKPFEYDIDIDALAEDINNAYYIEFDANGGEGSMPTQMMLPNEEVALLTNKFTKSGNVFVGWRVKDGDKTKVYIDGQDVINLGSPKETVVLEAVWASTEPVWVEKESGQHYYAAYPEGFDQNNSLYSKYNHEALQSGIDGNTKIVVEETKLYTYIYWHWTAYRKAPHNRYIGKTQGEKFASGAVATYFAAFESNTSYGHTDSTGETEPSNVFFCDRGGSTDGSWWWYQLPVYVQTYTIYESGN